MILKPGELEEKVTKHSQVVKSSLLVFHHPKLFFKCKWRFILCWYYSGTLIIFSGIIFLKAKNTMFLCTFLFPPNFHFICETKWDLKKKNNVKIWPIHNSPALTPSCSDFIFQSSKNNLPVMMRAHVILFSASAWRLLLFPPPEAYFHVPFI